MSKIFISYARKDKDEVYPIVDEIERNGFDCWIDKNGIESGDQFKNVILDAIDGCEIFIYMLSANTLASDWCQKEFNYANGFKKIIPVLLKGAKENRRLMFDFSTLDCIDIYDSVQKEKLIRDMKKLCGNDTIQESDTFKNSETHIKNETTKNDNNHSTFIDRIFGKKVNQFIANKPKTNSQSSEKTSISCPVSNSYIDNLIALISEKYIDINKNFKSLELRKECLKQLLELSYHNLSDEEKDIRTFLILHINDAIKGENTCLPKFITDTYKNLYEIFSSLKYPGSKINLNISDYSNYYFAYDYIKIHKYIRLNSRDDSKIKRCDITLLTLLYKIKLLGSILENDMPNLPAYCPCCKGELQFNKHEVNYGELDILWAICKKCGCNIIRTLPEHDIQEQKYFFSPTKCNRTKRCQTSSNHLKISSSRLSIKDKEITFTCEQCGKDTKVELMRELKYLDFSCPTCGGKLAETEYGSNDTIVSKCEDCNCHVLSSKGNNEIKKLKYFSFPRYCTASQNCIMKQSELKINGLLSFNSKNVQFKCSRCGAKSHTEMTETDYR